ncbi:MAG: type II toxin-antitoxin system VapC family toxin [Methylococcales bacterium]
MISIDTNVLLRYLLTDDITQYEKANVIISSSRPVLITDVVLAETVWTLKGKRYKYDKASICNVVRNLVGDSNFVFESNQVIWSSLCDFEKAKPIRGKELDFADSLIVHKSHLSAKNKGTHLTWIYSFDKAVQQLKGVNFLEC